MVIERLDLRKAAHAEVLAAVLSIERKSFSKADGWGGERRSGRPPAQARIPP